MPKNTKETPRKFQALLMGAGLSRNQIDALYLALTGGTLTGDLAISKNNAALDLVDDSGNISRMKGTTSQLCLDADPNDDDAGDTTDIIFKLDGSEEGRFLKGGNFGVGTVLPRQKIDARGSIIAKDGFATELWDVAGANFETAVVDTEYYSPNQHGGIYGVVYRQYFNTSLPAALTSGNAVAALIDYAIYFLSEGTNKRNVAHGAAAAAGTSDKRCSIWLDAASGNNNLEIDKESSGDDYEPIRGWVDYTK